MDGCNTSFLLGWPIFRGHVVLGRVTLFWEYFLVTTNTILVTTQMPDRVFGLESWLTQAARVGLVKKHGGIFK